MFTRTCSAPEPRSLRRKNPSIAPGKRRHKHFQWLTDNPLTKPRPRPVPMGVAVLLAAAAHSDRLSMRMSGSLSCTRSGTRVEARWKIEACSGPLAIDRVASVDIELRDAWGA